ncbi:MAG: glutamate synthase subunit beta [Kiritimatiellae bacterium]|nr:glutamate synthase subunit beta [Kiritimatiellia bacterium]
MGKPTGFMEYPRELPHKRPAAERIRDFREIPVPWTEAQSRRQAARCMDCGVPFCHTGCPLGNLIPEWNDLVWRGEWREAARRLHATNNFPEFTGRLCPAPCEEACVLGINEPPVTIEQIEHDIAERAFAEGWVRPEPPVRRTGCRVAIVGSGPAGLACAQQLNRAGHEVTVFERADRIGGLLRYGIPDFKLEKHILDRRLALLEAEGIRFRPGVHVGRDLHAEELRRSFDAIVLAIGATRPRDLAIPGRELEGIYFAMDYLPQQNRLVAGDALSDPITARGRRVIVIGGGDTGSDCIGTALRQGAVSVVNFELLPRPPVGRPPHQPWPFYPMRLRTSTSHEEGGERHFAISAIEFLGDRGRVRAVRTVDVRFAASPATAGPPALEPVPGSEREWPADLVILAMGFLGPETDGIVAQLGLELDRRGCIRTDEQYATSVPGIFAAGDGRRGQSLIVWAIAEGRECARAVDAHLSGDTRLPTKGEGDLPRV